VVAAGGAAARSVLPVAACVGWTLGVDAGDRDGFAGDRVACGVTPEEGVTEASGRLEGDGCAGFCAVCVALQAVSSPAARSIAMEDALLTHHVYPYPDAPNG
jgi:hypothetical protein